MVQYLDIYGNDEDLNELSKLLVTQGGESHLGTVQRFSAATPDIVTLLINMVPYASIAGVLIVWIRMK